MSIPHAKNVLETIGRTPLVTLNTIIPQNKRVFTKWEWLNPTLSMKDRIALHMIERYEKEQKLTQGMTIIAPSSGNTATSIAMVAVVKGYKVIITAPCKTSAEKIAYSKAFGAKVVICPSNVSTESPDYYINKAYTIASTLPHSCLIDQYQSLYNQDTHANTTGPEIWEQTQGQITHLVAAAGSGGTICGIARYLKHKKPSITVISPDVQGSVYGHYKKHGVCTPMSGNTLIEGVGKKNIPPNMDMSLIDRFVAVSDDKALAMCKTVATQEGVLIGGSSAACLCTALSIIPTMQKEDVMVVVFADSGVKYLSKLYNA